MEQTGADIIGHFDLVTKFNELGGYLDLSDPRYVRAWKAAVDALLSYDRPFEINTGAISRGYRTTPYPGAAVEMCIRDSFFTKQRSNFHGRCGKMKKT